MPELTVNGINLNYTEEGSGFPLILLHGLSDDHNLWTLLMPRFSEIYRTFTIDLRGHGQSEKPDMPYSIELFAADLFEFMKKLGISRANFAGLSMGAAIIQQFALEHPEMVNAMVLLSAFSYTDGYSKANFDNLRRSLQKGGLEAFFDKALELVVTPAFRKEYADSLGLLKMQAVRINSPAAISRAIDACEGFNLRDRVKAIKAPALILSGKEDVFTPTYFAAEIHRSIEGSELAVMEGVGHNLMVPENIDPLTKLILEFLEKHRADVIKT
jgi:3-oxoadipate enol-lactonase